MQKIIEDVLNANRMSYVLYSKGLNAPVQQKKFKGLCAKKPKQVFIIKRDPKNKLFFESIMEEEGLAGMEDLKYAVFRGETAYLASDTLEEMELREEIYDEIVNYGEYFLCEGCHEVIRSQKMKCESCTEPSYLCTFCFAKLIMSVEGDGGKCPKCTSGFLNLETKMFLDEMVELYKSNPRDLFTLLQKKKKQLPPALKNLTKIIQSAQQQAKNKGETLNFAG